MKKYFFQSLLSITLLTITLHLPQTLSQRLFNAPPNVKTGFQILGTDNVGMVQQYSNRETEYNITIDIYSFYINCGMHNSDYTLRAADAQALSMARDKGKDIHLMFECPAAVKSEWDAIRAWSPATLIHWRKFFDSFFSATGKRQVYFRPTQEFTNPVTGYPWVIEQGWNTPVSGCWLQKNLFPWATCNSGYYSNYDNIDSNRAELNAFIRNLRGVANAAATAHGSPLPYFVVTADGNTIFDDTTAIPKIAADLSAVCSGAADFVAMDAYSGQGGKFRDFREIFVSGFNQMVSEQSSLGIYRRGIPELGVDQGQKNRSAQICAATKMPGITFLIYWDDVGAQGQYKLDRDTANARCTFG